MAEKRTIGIAGLFDEPEALLAAAERVREAGYRAWDCHTPYPVHGIERAMGLPWSPVAALALTGGLAGAAIAMGMQVWMNAIDYPLNIGGKPLFSWPAFIPITFELFVLFTALSTVALGCVFCRLLRWHSPLRDSGILAEVTGNRFAIVIEARDERFTEDGARRLLVDAGCRDVRPLVEFEEEARPLL